MNDCIHELSTTNITHSINLKNRCFIVVKISTLLMYTWFAKERKWYLVTFVGLVNFKVG